jgi:hypothetical protein
MNHYWASHATRATLILGALLAGHCSDSSSDTPGSGGTAGDTGSGATTGSGAATGSGGTPASGGSGGSNTTTGPEPVLVQVTPTYLDRGIRNPLKGFTRNGGWSDHPFATTAHVYIRWNELEDVESDGIDRIIAVSNERFAGLAENNVKAIPRVYLHWSGDAKYWPSDMVEDDYSSPQFQARVTRLVERLGQVWNDDPRVGFIEMGIFGMWGEHHSPSPDGAMQALVGQAFTDAFPDKQVSVRHVWDQFSGFPVGSYWDSFAHYDQMWEHGEQISNWIGSDPAHLTRYVGGETAYDWGSWETQPGENPTDSVSDPTHRNFIANTIRWLHTTQLRWIDGYDASDPTASAGAEELQRVLGYRYRLESVAFTPDVLDGTMEVSFSVLNEGSAPFYYDWPVEVALHDVQTREVVWKGTFDDVDIRSWTPGAGWTEPEWTPVPGGGWPYQQVNDGWSTQPLEWAVPPATHETGQTFTVNAPDGVYVLSLAVLDPGGMVPSLRFATANYFNGGRHPVGLVAVGTTGGGALPADFSFDDPTTDDTLYYLP